MSRYNLEWKVGYTVDPSALPERFVPATVPGAAQLDWARFEGWPLYWKDNDMRRYEWMERVYWIYRAKLPAVDLRADERLRFVCGGVDYRCIVRLRGETVHGQEGMFSSFELDVTDAARAEQEIEIVVFPAPDGGGEVRGRAEARQSVKPAVSYGWDFHPRLVPAGIWRETYLEIRRDRHVKDVWVDYSLQDDFAVARLDLSFEISQPARGSLEWALLRPDGEIADAQSILLDGQAIVDGAAEVFDPELWWPSGYGEQPLYSLAVSLHDEEGQLIDRKTRRIGFRRCRLAMNDGAWDEPSATIKTRSAPPICLEINGRRVFVKGSNWVAPDIFPGVIGEDAYRPLLEKAKAANLNLLRCWGGAAINKPSFYSLCDELGILVWQDFPLACNCYEDDPEYLDTLNRESVSILKLLKPHPCVAIWCGGNELFNQWSGMTDQHKAIRLLNRNCFELDPDTPFLPTTPIMGVGHGGYLFVDKDGRECFETMQSARCTAYVEFGLPGPASVETLRSFIGEDELFPPRPGGQWETRHGFRAWEGDPESWLCLPTIERYFGRPESIEELVQGGQLLQAEGYKALFEEARRQKPYCSMAINWCFNEPWPTAANNSLIGWPCEPKPAYRAVKQSCRPTLASARVRKFSWSEGEVFEAELWMLNDAPKTVKGDRVEAYLRFDDEETFVLGWYFDALDPDENRMGPTLRARVPAIESQVFQLFLKVEGRADWNSEYVFCFRERTSSHRG